MVSEMETSNVIFGFNGNEVGVMMTEQKAKELFYNLTGVTIIDNDDGNYRRIRHPTTQQLVELFKKNINEEVGSEIIKNSFYPNYRGEWAKILVNIYDKIQNALTIVEISENGEYEKRKCGKYVRYKFFQNKRIVTLDNYGIG